MSEGDVSVWERLHNVTGELPGDYSKRLVSLCKAMLRYNADDRINASSALQHQYFDEVRSNMEALASGRLEFA
jgi:serine/threonine protein kinase